MYSLCIPLTIVLSLSNHEINSSVVLPPQRIASQPLPDDSTTDSDSSDFIFTPLFPSLLDSCKRVASDSDGFTAPKRVCQNDSSIANPTTDIISSLVACAHLPLPLSSPSDIEFANCCRFIQWLTMHQSNNLHDSYLQFTQSGHYISTPKAVQVPRFGNTNNQYYGDLLEVSRNIPTTYCSKRQGKRNTTGIERQVVQATCSCLHCEFDIGVLNVYLLRDHLIER